MRGTAILMVIAVHTSLSVPGLPQFAKLLCAYGQMGVQLFFVASAYTLSRSHVARSAEPHALANFYLRRFFRIAPLYYVAIALYLALYVASHDVGAAVRGYYSARNVAANLFFLHGFVASANNHVVPGGWSIGTEVAFYAIFPALFA
jgi:peptidoglycan/LPS O-acetylase OafA/YrhL